MHSIRDPGLSVFVAAAALTAWGLVGLLGPAPGYTDALFEPDYTISFVPPGGPLEEAGVQTGDSVVAVEGIPVQELGMYSRWPRSLARRPGESIRMTLDRDGARVDVDVTYRDRPAGVTRARRIALLTALLFLWAGVWVFASVPSSPATTLLILGFAMAVGAPGPDIGVWNGVRDHLQAAGMTLAALLLARFFLEFPRPKRIVQSRDFGIALFLPWAALLACLAIELVFHPRFYHTFGGFAGILLIGYILTAAAAAIHTAIRLPRSELRTSGMTLIFGGFAVALLPNLFAIGGWFAGFSTPGQQYFPLLLALVPLALALAVRRHASSAGRGPSGAT